MARDEASARKKAIDFYEIEPAVAPGRCDQARQRES